MNSDDQSPGPLPDELQKMLALKRHEAPPPRFFRNFSERVIDRLNTPEPPPPPTLRNRLGLDIDSRPILVCGSGVLVCSLLVVGLIASLRLGPPKPLPRTIEEQPFFIFVPQPSVAPLPAVADDASPHTSAALRARLGDPVSVPSSSPFTPLGSPPSLPTTAGKPATDKNGP